MKNIVLIITTALISYKANCQQLTKVLPGNIIVRGDSITLQPFSKTMYGVRAIHIDYITSNDSLTEVYYLQKVNVPQQSGKLYLKSNEVVRIYFYRNYFKGWEHSTPKGIDSINFIHYLSNPQIQ